MKSLWLKSFGGVEASLERCIDSDSADFVIKDGEGRALLLLDVKSDGALGISFVCQTNAGDGICYGELQDEDEEILREAVRQLLEEESLGIEGDGADKEADVQPFNPKDISMITRVVTMETLMRRIEQGTIKLNPDFQRKEVWDQERKSRLIESLFLRIPIPMFYVSSDSDDNWSVVDGLQRISTMRDFILGKKYLKSHRREDKGNGFRLENLEFWHDYDGFVFNDLPVALQNRILEAEFSFTIINPPTPEDVKLNIFKRINTGGMRLSSQEIRNALYIGPSTELLRKLAGSKTFQDATDHSIHADRMQDQELVLRMLSFMIRDYGSYNRTYTSDEWLSQTMLLLNYSGAMSVADRNAVLAVIKRNRISMDGYRELSYPEIEEMFELAMKRSRKLFGKYAFRKSYAPLRRTPINKSLFEVWGNILVGLTEEEFKHLYSNRKRFEKDYHKVMGAADFVIAISRDSMKWQSVKLRYDTLKQLCDFAMYG